MRITRLVPARLIGGKYASAIGRRVFPPVDTALQRATRGRASLTRAIGMRLLMLETIGRRSGEPRVTPLIFATQDSDFVVVGSNWGQAHNPAWALNLVANPDAVATLDGERIPVRARRLTEQERAEVWPLMLEVYPAYDEYARRVQASSGREIMVFRLERA
ncbi:nitroreductase family deazaflavin-dependent oxidoreductase [Actinospica sp. MGRD01-02]|uniref:Nitroreductase family deazaflavin-dependent oxidoreductase n=1 Tax=Actinospica acidithermotolerans TaxID=2828514 RepID=A0A941EES6_9ACTN|nr:nitroreductase/quinone reductase family protein [Actinospica acidithermotolerans]MBR7829083.1 nitroreductase family deazaflavin-dependent oxidoreductase [Actinospica acidithermotolerans]